MYVWQQSPPVAVIMRAATKDGLGTSRGLTRQPKLNASSFPSPEITYKQGYRNYDGRVV